MTVADILGGAVPYIYILSAVLFIFGLKRQSKVRTARFGNLLAAFAMFLAVVGTLLDINFSGQIAHTIDYRWIAGGAVVGGAIGWIAAVKVPMTAMPEMVAIFNGFGGGASALVAGAVTWNGYLDKVGVTGTIAENLPGGNADAISVPLTVIIGGVTFSGSMIAYLKLQGKLKKGAPILLPGRHFINLLLLAAAIGLTVWFGFMADTHSNVELAVLVLAAVSLVLGILVVIPIGGADMPVVVSLLNSYSGLAGCAAGFVIQNNLLIIAGSLVGAAGMILTHIMCVAMNRSLINVIAGGFGVEEGSQAGSSEYTGVTSCGTEEAAMVLENAESVIFVPGYGLAVAQAQHAVRELADILEKRGTKVSYAIHPVAGRMPGHMNVLLAEADVPYEQLVEMDDINPEFKNTDVAIVLGANDVVNPAALSDKTSPIYGMPILEVHNARTVFVVKRSLGAGYAGIKNTLFEADNTMMVFGDAKKVVQGLINEMKALD